MNLRPRKIRNQLFQWVSTKPHVEALWSLSIRSSSLKVPGPGLGTSDLETVGQVQAQVSSSRDVAGSHMETGTQKTVGEGRRGCQSALRVGGSLEPEDETSWSDHRRAGGFQPKQNLCEGRRLCPPHLRMLKQTSSHRFQCPFCLVHSNTDVR